MPTFDWDAERVGARELRTAQLLHHLELLINALLRRLDAIERSVELP